MKIVDCLFSKSYTGFYFDDQKAIKSGAKMDGFTYLGDAITPGFSKIRQSGEAISVMLILEDGQIGLGDCCAVQYSGTGGRDPLFLAEEYIPFLYEQIKPLLLNREVDTFKSFCEEFDQLLIDGNRLHTAIRYGITQAIVDACAKANHLTIAEVVRREYNINETNYLSIPVFTQSGDDRYINVDKMIIKKADVLPHALINNVESKLGYNGEILLEYVTWLRNRILKLRDSESYLPVLHIDVYGTIGIAFNYDIEKISLYLKSLVDAASPFKLRIEGPGDLNEREQTMLFLKELTVKVDELGIDCEIVADEWCNTYEDIVYFADNKAGHMLQIKTPDLGGITNIIESIIYCKQKGIGAYSGGTCNETNLSAQVTTNIAIACNADQCLAKPGMGTDEGYMIVKNEMNRVITIANNRKGWC